MKTTIGTILLNWAYIMAAVIFLFLGLSIGFYVGITSECSTQSPVGCVVGDKTIYEGIENEVTDSELIDLNTSMLSDLTKEKRIKFIKNKLTIDKLNNNTGLYFVNKQVICIKIDNRTEKAINTTKYHEAAHHLVHKMPKHYCGWYVNETIKKIEIEKSRGNK